MNRKIICFSLWGNNPMYTVGAIKNSILQKKFFPDWTCRFYVDGSVPVEVINILKDNRSEVVYKESNINSTGLFWRYSCFFGDNNKTDDNVYIFRDTDSRLSNRDYVAIKEWLESKKTFHVMRDWPGHLWNIMGAMWGVNFSLINKEDKEKINGEFTNFLNNNKTINYGDDEKFLGDTVWQYVKKDCISHISFNTQIKIGDEKKFPLNWINNHDFIGNKYDHNDVPQFKL